MTMVWKRSMAADYMQKVGVSNFKNAWDSMDPDTERVNEYGLGTRDNLVVAVSAAINILDMQPCEGTDTVPSNARSHTYGLLEILLLVLVSSLFFVYSLDYTRSRLANDAKAATGGMWGNSMV